MSLWLSLCALRHSSVLCALLDTTFGFGLAIGLVVVIFWHVKHLSGSICPKVIGAPVTQIRVVIGASFSVTRICLVGVFPFDIREASTT